MALSYLITRDQLNDAGTTIDTGAGKVTADEFAMLLSQRRRQLGGRDPRAIERTAQAETSQAALEAQLGGLQAGIRRLQAQAAGTSSNQ